VRVSHLVIEARFGLGAGMQARRTRGEATFLAYVDSGAYAVIDAMNSHPCKP
jgi:hypothetical protein